LLKTGRRLRDERGLGAHLETREPANLPFYSAHGSAVQTVSRLRNAMGRAFAACGVRRASSSLGLFDGAMHAPRPSVAAVRRLSNVPTAIRFLHPTA
jgi:hypothetical protein